MMTLTRLLTQILRYDHVDAVAVAGADGRSGTPSRMLMRDDADAVAEADA